jgi:2-keto-4-pentenoate hydratase/2-oxohepta-3-ene-1,7-dioic acid hydratase in catechol pathway
VKDPNNLAITARVNGVTMQQSNTRDMIFSVAEIIEFLSGSTTLEPNTLILTGTPEGVGMGRKPPVYLKAGDVVEVEIEGIGVLRNPVVEEDISSF